MNEQIQDMQGQQKHYGMYGQTVTLFAGPLWQIRTFVLGPLLYFYLNLMGLLIEMLVWDTFSEHLKCTNKAYLK